MTASVKTIEGDMSARGLRIGIVASRFNDFIVDRLLAGAISTLLKHGVEGGDVTVARVPGAFEIPLVVAKMGASRRYDAIIALGCVIRGATPHFDYVAGEAASGLSAACLKYEVPVSFGVLTVDTIEQAIETATLLRRLEQ